MVFILSDPFGVHFIMFEFIEGFLILTCKKYSIQKSHKNLKSTFKAKHLKINLL